MKPTSDDADCYYIVIIIFIIFARLSSRSIRVFLSKSPFEIGTKDADFLFFSLKIILKTTVHEPGPESRCGLALLFCRVNLLHDVYILGVHHLQRQATQEKDEKISHH